MKLILSLLFFFFSQMLFAQDAVISDNTLSYRNKTYSEGDIIHLGYGSSADKDFSFVHFGKAPAGMKIPGLYRKANADWSKAEIEITKIYSEKGVAWVKGEPTNRGKNPGGLLGNKIYINLAGAVDNREIVSVERGIGTTSKKTLKTTAADSKNNLKLSKEQLAAQLSDTKLKLKQAYGDTKEKLKVSAGEVKMKIKGTTASLKEELTTQSKTLKAKGKEALEEGKTKIKTEGQQLAEKGKESLKEAKKKIKG